MSSPLLNPTMDRLHIAGGAQRLVVPRLSGLSLPGEVDYDDLRIHSHWREYDSSKADTVRYLMYKLSQRDAGEIEQHEFYKAIRLIRLTRVPRYLREAGKDAGALFDQQRDVLSALRQEDVMFLTLIGKAPDLPMIFSYGVQATGETPEEAQSIADRSYAVLSGQLDGTYQQLEYTQLRSGEVEALVRYQSEWGHLVVARGRPMPTGGTSTSSSVLDGNRTDVEQTANQLESFLRGMGTSSFLMSLVFVPVPPIEITRAWRNIAYKLSDVRSDTDGARIVSAGIAIPAGLGLGHTDSASQSHSGAEAVGTSSAVSHTATHTDGQSATVSASHTIGQASAHTQAQTSGISDTAAVTQGAAHSVSASQTVGHAQSIGQSTGFTEGHSVGQSVGTGHTQTEQVGQSISAAHGVSASQSLANGASAGLAHTQTASQSQSASVGSSLGSSWSDGASQSATGGHTVTDGLSHSLSQSLQQNFGVTDASGNSIGDSSSVASNTNVGVGALGAHAGSAAGTSDGFTRTGTDTNTLSSGLTGGATSGAGVSQSQAVSASQTSGISESVGGSASQSVTDGASVGLSSGATASQAVSQVATSGVGSSESLSESQSQSLGVAQSVMATQSIGQTQALSQTASFSQSASQAQAVGQVQSVSQAASQAHAVSASQSNAVSQSQSLSDTTGQSASQSASDAVGVARTQSLQRGLTDAYLAGMGKSSQMSSSLGLIPSFGISISRQTRDEAKRVLGDILEAQMRRYLEGIESGAYLYQLFLQAPDPETLARAAGLMKSSFWGPGAKARLPQPFHVVDDFEPGDERRLLAHARVFSSYRKRESNIELVEPYVYSTYVTPGEAATFCHPPTAESLGLLAVHDSMPVFAMPFDRAQRDVYLGRIVNGERANVTDQHFGIDVDEITHTLVAGTTGSGKTTTVLRLLVEAVNVHRNIDEVIRPDDPASPIVTRPVSAGALILDWKSTMRSIARVVDPDRFRFYSMSKPVLGRFRWNLLSVPATEISPIEWVNTVADLFQISYGLGEYARSIIWEHLNELYSANRLDPYVLRPPVYDAAGDLTRPGIVLDPIDRNLLPEDAIEVDAAGNEYANVYTYPALSRLIGLGELAIAVAAKIETLSSPDAGRMFGTEMRNRYQTVWRRLQYFAPGGPLAAMFTHDDRLDEPECLQVPDLVDPDKGLVTVIEADGLDMGNRRLVLGSILMSVWRYGQAKGDGAFNNNNRGPGTFVVLEEAHELFGSRGDGEDRESVATRTAIYESMFRRARSLGLKLVAVVQNASDIPPAITSNTNTVIFHRQYDIKDRQVAANLLNWESRLDHRREMRYLGEMPVGWSIVRLDPKQNYLEAAPVHIVTEPVDLDDISDLELLNRSR